MVVGNDYDESLLAYDARPGVHVYAKDADGRLHLTRNDYAPSLMRSVVRHSALGRYLVFNLDAVETAKQVAARWGLSSTAQAAEPQFAGNTAAEASPERVRDSQGAVLAFFDDLAKTVPLPPDRIAFVMDGARYQSDVAFVERSYFGIMRNYFMREAAARGYEVIDMQREFLARSRDRQSHFEYPTDGHWNPIGHEVVAQALGASRLYGKIFAPK